MDASKDYVLFVALQGSHHHVGRVDGVHVVWREGRVLFTLVDRLVVQAINHGDILQHSLDDVLLSQGLVRLNTREAKRSQPLHGVAVVSYFLGALGKPLLDVVGVSEQVTNTLDGDFGGVLGCSEQLSLAIPLLSVG